MTNLLLNPDLDDELTGPYWKGFQEEQLRLPYCTDCTDPHWPPRNICPHCGETSITWEPIEAVAKLFTWVKINYHFNIPTFEDEVPINTGLVVPIDAESIRLAARIREPRDNELHIGKELEAEFVRTEDGLLFPVFHPVE